MNEFDLINQRLENLESQIDITAYHLGLLQEKFEALERPQ